MHQARVLAMQALFEDDLTEHGLDDILQHLGEQERKEHGDYHARLRSDAKKAIEEIGFLARNAGDDAPGDAVSRYRDATAKALGGLFEAPEPEEGDLPHDQPPRNRTGMEKTLKSMLLKYRNEAERHLPVAESPDPVHRDERVEVSLGELEAEITRQVESTLASEERAARETLMDLLGRTVRLARGVEANLGEIDPHIERAAPAFPIPQLASIDRAVLRIAVYELLFEPNVPFKAAINEAVEIAKRYGGPNSGRFVNGVLRTISEGLPASRKEPKPRA